MLIFIPCLTSYHFLQMMADLGKAKAGEGEAPTKLDDDSDDSDDGGPPPLEVAESTQ